MNRISTLIIIHLLFLSIISIQLTSSVSFPNPPQKPPSNASPDEQALFWKLLHNYYAIMARPRFGKRFDSGASYSKYSSLTPIVNHHSIDGISSPYDMDRILNNNVPNTNEQEIDLDNVYLVGYPDQKPQQRSRRRRYH